MRSPAPLVVVYAAILLGAAASTQEAALAHRRRLRDAHRFVVWERRPR